MYCFKSNLFNSKFIFIYKRKKKEKAIFLLLLLLHTNTIIKINNNILKV